MKTEFKLAEIDKKLFFMNFTMVTQALLQFGQEILR